MEEYIKIFLTSLLIMVVVISPLPSLPFLIMNYTLNGFLNGVIAFYFGLVGALTCHYYIGLKFKSLYSKISNNRSLYSKISNNRSLLSKLFLNSKYIKKTSKKVIKIISNLSALEFFLLRLSSVLPFKLVNIASGLNKRPFIEYILITMIAQTPSQIIYFSASSQASKIDKITESLGIQGYESLLAKVSICSLIALMMIIILRFFIKKLGFKTYKI